eukprot:10448091-Prorocentrum_lima.AAC.1
MSRNEVHMYDARDCDQELCKAQEVLTLEAFGEVWLDQHDILDTDAPHNGPKDAPVGVASGPVWKADFE